MMVAIYFYRYELPCVRYTRFMFSTSVGGEPCQDVYQYDDSDILLSIRTPVRTIHSIHVFSNNETKTRRLVIGFPIISDSLFSEYYTSKTRFGTRLFVKQDVF